MATTLLLRRACTCVCVADCGTCAAQWKACTMSMLLQVGASNLTDLTAAEEACSAAAVQAAVSESGVLSSVSKQGHGAISPDAMLVSCCRPGSGNACKAWMVSMREVYSAAVGPRCCAVLQRDATGICRRHVELLKTMICPSWDPCNLCCAGHDATCASVWADAVEAASQRVANRNANLSSVPLSSGVGSR